MRYIHQNGLAAGTLPYTPTGGIISPYPFRFKETRYTGRPEGEEAREEKSPNTFSGLCTEPSNTVGL